MTPYETFLQLHYQPMPVLIGNVWDAASAKIFEQKGYKAIATSSIAVARMMGYDDGEKIPFELLLLVVERISKSVNLPLSVDMEGGYSRSIPGIIANIEKLYALGVVGINIEDTAKDGSKQMIALDEFKQIISAVAGHLFAKNIPMFINARTDAFVHKLPGAVAETIKRAKAYEDAGASGIFVPFMDKRDDIKAVVQSTNLPVSVFNTPQLPAFDELAQLGIKRISMGGAGQRYSSEALARLAATVREQQSFAALY